MGFGFSFAGRRDPGNGIPFRIRHCSNRRWRAVLSLCQSSGFFAPSSALSKDSSCVSSRAILRACVASVVFVGFAPHGWACTAAPLSLICFSSQRLRASVHFSRRYHAMSVCDGTSCRLATWASVPWPSTHSLRHWSRKASGWRVRGAADAVMAQTSHAADSRASTLIPFSQNQLSINAPVHLLPPFPIAGVPGGHSREGFAAKPETLLCLSAYGGAYLALVSSVRMKPTE